jgi:hypothetical protein
VPNCATLAERYPLPSKVAVISVTAFLWQADHRADTIAG